MYNSFDDVDVWVGGILETGDGPGELFQRIIRDQFQRIRDGDRFWYNNTVNGCVIATCCFSLFPVSSVFIYPPYDFFRRLFTDKEIERLEQLSFYDILMCTTKMDSNDIPRNPFRVPTAGKGRDI